MFAASLARRLALLTSKLCFSSPSATRESRLATLVTFVGLRGIGTPSTRLRPRREISARPARAATAVPTAAAAVPLAMMPAPLRALSAMESTVLPTAPTFLPTAPTFSPMPSGFEAGRFGREDLAGLEVERAREEPEARFGELLLLRDAERELVVFRGLAVVGMGPLLFS
jgi:hypothetical protein